MLDTHLLLVEMFGFGLSEWERGGGGGGGAGGGGGGNSTYPFWRIVVKLVIQRAALVGKYKTNST